MSVETNTDGSCEHLNAVSAESRATILKRYRKVMSWCVSEDMRMDALLNKHAGSVSRFFLEKETPGSIIRYRATRLIRARMVDSIDWIVSARLSFLYRLYPGRPSSISLSLVRGYYM